MKGVVTYVTQPIKEYFIHRMYLTFHAFDRSSIVSFALLLIKALELALLNLPKSLSNTSTTSSFSTNYTSNLGLFSSVIDHFNSFLATNDKVLLLSMTVINSLLFFGLIIDQIVYMHTKSQSNSQKSKHLISQPPPRNTLQRSPIVLTYSFFMKSYQFIFFIPSIIISFQDSQGPAYLQLINLILTLLLAIFCESVNYDFRHGSNSRDFLARRPNLAQNYTRMLHELVSACIFSYFSQDTTTLLHVWNLITNTFEIICHFATQSFIERDIQATIISIHAILSILSGILAISTASFSQTISSITFNIPLTFVSISPLAAVAAWDLFKYKSGNQLHNFLTIELKEEQNRINNSEKRNLNTSGRSSSSHEFLDQVLRQLGRDIKVDFDEYLNSKYSLLLECIVLHHQRTCLNSTCYCQQDDTISSFSPENHSSRLKYVQDYIASAYKQDTRDSETSIRTQKSVSINLFSSYLFYLLSTKSNEVIASCELIRFKRNFSKSTNISWRGLQSIEYLSIQLEQHYSTLTSLRLKKSITHTSTLISPINPTSPAPIPTTANTLQQILASPLPEITYTTTTCSYTTSENLYSIITFDTVFDNMLVEFETCLEIKSRLLVILGQDHIDLEKLIEVATSLRSRRIIIHDLLLALLQANRAYQKLQLVCSLYESSFSFDDTLKLTLARHSKGIYGETQSMPLHSSDTCVIYASLLRESLGRIMKVSRNFSSVFDSFSVPHEHAEGAAQTLNSNITLLPQKNVRELLPPAIQAQHDRILAQFTRKNDSLLATHTQLPLQICTSKHGWAIPYEIRVQFHMIAGQEFGVAAWIRKIRSSSLYLQIEIKQNTTGVATATSKRISDNLSVKDMTNTHRSKSSPSQQQPNPQNQHQYEIIAISERLFQHLFPQQFQSSLEKLKSHSRIDMNSVIPDLQTIYQDQSNHSNREQKVISVRFSKQQQQYSRNPSIPPGPQEASALIGECKLYKVTNEYLNLLTFEILSLRPAEHHENAYLKPIGKQILSQQPMPFQTQKSLNQLHIHQLIGSVQSSQIDIKEEDLIRIKRNYQQQFLSGSTKSEVEPLDTPIVKQSSQTNNPNNNNKMLTLETRRNNTEQDRQFQSTLMDIPDDIRLVSPASARPLLSSGVFQHLQTTDRLFTTKTGDKQVTPIKHTRFFPNEIATTTNSPIDLQNFQQSEVTSLMKTSKKTAYFLNQSNHNQDQEVPVLSPANTARSALLQFTNRQTGESQTAQRSGTGTGTETADNHILIEGDKKNNNHQVQEQQHEGENAAASVRSSEKTQKSKNKKQLGVQIRQVNRIIGLRVINSLGVMALLLILILTTVSFYLISDYLNTKEVQLHYLNWNSNVRIAMSSLISNMYLAYAMRIKIFPIADEEITPLANATFVTSKSFIPIFQNLVRQFSSGDKDAVTSFSELLSTRFDFTQVKMEFRDTPLSTSSMYFTEFTEDISLAYALLLTQANFDQLSTIPDILYRPSYTISEFNQIPIQNALESLQTQVFDAYTTKSNDISEYMLDEVIIILSVTLLFAFSVLPIYSFIQQQREQIVRLMATIPALSLAQDYNANCVSLNMINRLIPKNYNKSKNHGKGGSKSSSVSLKEKDMNTLMKKKRNISTTSYLQKYDFKYLAGALMFFVLLQIYSIIIYLQIDYSLLTTQTNSRLMNNFAETSRYLQFSMGSNYIAFYAKARPQAVLRDSTYYWSESERIVNESSVYLSKMLEYKSFFNTLASRYKNTIYEEYLVGMLESNVCATIDTHRTYLKESLVNNFDRIQCESVEDSILQKGILAALNFLFDLDKQTVEIIINFDSTEFEKRISAFFDRYNIRELNALMITIGDILTQATYFLEVMTMDLLNQVSTINKTLFVVQLFAIAFTLFFGWFPFYSRVEQSLQDTKLLLDVLDVTFLLENSYVLSYFKATQP